MLSSARWSLSTKAGRCRYQPRDGQRGGAGRGCRSLSWLRPFCHQLDQTGQHVFCVCGTKVNVLDVASGAVLRSLEQVRVGRARAGDWCGGQPVLMCSVCSHLQEDQEDITAFELSPDDQVDRAGTGGGHPNIEALRTCDHAPSLPAELHLLQVLVTATRALLLAQWAWREGSITRLWKAIHTAPVATMAFDPTSTLLATGRALGGWLGHVEGTWSGCSGTLTTSLQTHSPGGCDGAVRVWDIVRHYGTHHFRGSPGVVHLVTFHPDPARLLLFSSAADATIRMWSLQDQSCLAVMTAHYSAVTSLTFSADGHTMLSSGRDKICVIWDLQSHQATRTVPVFESVEAAVLLPEELVPKLDVKSKGLHFLTAGDQGLLRVWEAASGQCVYAQPQPPGPRQGLTHCTLAQSAGLLLSVTTDHNLLLYEARSLQLQKQFAGYSEEVLDVRFLGPEDSHIVVASNSPSLKVFELQTMTCQILHGHTDIVLALDVFRKGRLFASCAKDQSICIWRMNKAGRVACVAQGSGHTHSVGTICCSRLKETFLVTGSQDCTVKLWPIPEALLSKGTAPDSGPILLQAQATQRCHDKDINSVAVAPNDKLLATGSQDRTAKLWALPHCQLLGIFSGHRRGLWCVQFSPMDQVLATASADGTIKLWALQDFSCLKTFEGHDASVLKVVFVSRGTQLLSSGSDGLVKLWTIKNNECVKTLDAHEDKVWGLHCSRLDDRALTGASDSCVILWKDVTEEEQSEEQARREEEVVKQQELDNLLYEKRYLRALGLAISLDRPHTVLTVIQAIRRDPEACKKLGATVLRLRRDQKEALLRFCVTWNTNSRHCHEAQAVLGVLLRHEAPEELLAYPGVQASLEALLPYTERHFQRLSRTLQAATFLDFLWHNMKLPTLPTAPSVAPSAL
uniref:U3 small nucleolar RNA-associated protein 13 C-terminal domain-containing protein n=1 Tax=Canis lupus familiaris TaxID=9615 RepID=A0A8C0P265_CANLF